MSQYNKTNFKALYGAMGSIFPDNTTEEISEGDVRQFGEDIADSLVFQSEITGLWDDRGNYDASGNVFPSSGGSGVAGAVVTGDIWTVSVAGTLGGTPVTLGDTVRALVDTPGQTAGNWAINVSGSTTAIKITDGVVNLKVKVISIGDWNIYVTGGSGSATKSVAHSLSDFKKVRGVSVTVRNDADTSYYIIPVVGVSVNYIDATNINLSSSLDFTGFSMTSYNRGWITIWYEE